MALRYGNQLLHSYPSFWECVPTPHLPSFMKTMFQARFTSFWSSAMFLLRILFFFSCREKKAKGTNLFLLSYFPPYQDPGMKSGDAFIKWPHMVNLGTEPRYQPSCWVLHLQNTPLTSCDFYSIEVMRMQWSHRNEDIAECEQSTAKDVWLHIHLPASLTVVPGPSGIPLSLIQCVPIPPSLWFVLVTRRSLLPD